MFEPSGAHTAPTFIEWFAGVGGFARGFLDEGFEFRGGFDFDAQCCIDHEMLTGHSLHQVDVQALTPSDVLRLFGMEAPDVLTLSPPCKGLSRLLPTEMAETDKYKAMNSLSYYAVWLALEAWSHRPPPIICIENVPAAASSEFFSNVTELMERHDYKIIKDAHDCGEIGELAQRRRRMLLMGRHRAQISDHCPVLLPIKKEPLPVSAVLSLLPVPQPRAKGAPKTMHDAVKIAPKNAVRLALIEAGRDWKAVPPLVALGEDVWGARWGCTPFSSTYGVQDWDLPGSTVIGNARIDTGRFALKDPRLPLRPGRFNGPLGIVRWDDAGHTIVGYTSAGGFWGALQDPRVHPGSDKRYPHGFGVLRWGEPSKTIRGSQLLQTTFSAVADGRLKHSPYRGGHGVQRWGEPANTVIGEYRSCKGANVADPRDCLPMPTHRVRLPDGRGGAVGLPRIEGPPLDMETNTGTHDITILAADGTVHRPMTPLELFVIQGFNPFDSDGQFIKLDGEDKKRWKMAIGNAMPPTAARAIAKTCKETLRAAGSGGLMLFGADREVWVEPALCPVEVSP